MNIMLSIYLLLKHELLKNVLYDSPPGGYPPGTQAIMVLIFFIIPLIILIVAVIALVLLIRYIRKKLKKND